MVEKEKGRQECPVETEQQKLFRLMNSGIDFENRVSSMLSQTQEPNDIQVTKTIHSVIKAYKRGINFFEPD